MNERIRKLAEQAGFYFYDMHNVNGEDLGETIEADSWTAADKFAELIVRECLKCGDKLAKCYIENHPEYEQAWLLASIADYSRQIGLTFGVHNENI